MTPPVAIFSDAAQALLATALATWPVGDGDRPAEAYVEHLGGTTGPLPVLGCSRLVVTVARVSAGRGNTEPGGPAGGRIKGQPVKLSVAFTVTLYRCGAPFPELTADGTFHPVPPADVDAYSTQTLADLSRLWVQLHDQWRADALFGTPPKINHHSVDLGDMLPFGPEAGIGGWTVPIVATV